MFIPVILHRDDYLKPFNPIFIIGVAFFIKPLHKRNLGDSADSFLWFSIVLSHRNNSGNPRIFPWAKPLPFLVKCK